jgi:hypothetical protein
MCTVEDLWDLSLEALDKIYKELNSALKSRDEESLLNKKTAQDEVLSLKIELVKHVFNTLQKEQQERRDAAERAAKKQKIMNLIAEKQDAELRDKSKDELEQMLNEL